MSHDILARSGWARLIDFIQRATGQQHAGSVYTFLFDSSTGNASLKLLGMTARYTASTEAEGREGCAREAISRGIFQRFIDGGGHHPARTNELKKLAVSYANLNRLPSMRELYPEAASPVVSHQRAYNGVPPNVPSLFLASPPSAYERLQNFLSDIYGSDSDIFEHIDFAQAKEGQSPWSINILGREYACTSYYTDKKTGQEAAVRHAFEAGALSVLVRDRQPPPSHHASALDLVAKFNDLASLSPLPSPAPIPTGSRTPMPGNIGHMSPFHPAAAYGATMNGGQSPYHMAGAQSPYTVMAGAQSPYIMPPQSPYINGGFAYPVQQEEPKKRSRSSSRRRSRSPKRRSRSKHRSRSKRRRTPESESESESSDDRRSRRSRRKSRRKRRASSSEAKEKDKAEDPGKPAEIESIPPVDKDVNADLSPFLDYILDRLESIATKDDSQLKSLLSKLDSGNREKMHLIRQACDAVTHVQSVCAVADKDLDAGQYVVLPKPWVEQVLSLLSE